MVESFLAVANQVGVLALMMALGYAASKKRILSGEAVRGIVDLLIFIVAPCLIVTAFQRPFTRSEVTAALVALVLSLAIQFIGLGVSLAIRLSRRPDTEGVLRFSVIFSNAGFMGLPLEQALLGDAGVFYGAIYVAVFNLTSWTMGLAVMCGNFKELAPARLLRNPGLVGIALGLPLFLASVRLPEPVYSAVKSVGDLNTPLAMITIGYYLEKAHLGKVLAMPAAYWAAFLRLFGVSAVTLPVLWFFFRGFPMPAAVMAIVTSAPAAAMTTMFASRFGKDVDTSVGIVAGTTLLSILTMPVVVGFAMWLFKI